MGHTLPWWYRLPTPVFTWWARYRHHEGQHAVTALHLCEAPTIGVGLRARVERRAGTQHGITTLRTDNE
jgi:hypothetical protein